MQVVICNARFCLPELKVEVVNYFLHLVRLRNVACVLHISFETSLENVLDINFSFLIFRCERHTVSCVQPCLPPSSLAPSLWSETRCFLTFNSVF